LTGRNDETLATAKSLTDALNDMAVEVKGLRAYGRRNRKWIVFDIAVTVALAVISFIAVHAGESAHNAQVAAVAAKAAAKVAEQDNRNLCESSNVARAQAAGLWGYIIHLSPPPATAQARARLAAFEHHLAVVYAPRDCGHPNPKTP
jgi:hypothetical protein